MAELLSDFAVRQSVPELMQLAQSTTGIYSHFPANIEHTLMQMMREANGVTMRPALRFSTVQVQGVIEKGASSRNGKNRTPGVCHVVATVS